MISTISAIWQRGEHMPYAVTLRMQATWSALGSLRTRAGQLLGPQRALCQRAVRRDLQLLAALTRAGAVRPLRAAVASIDTAT